MYFCNCRIDDLEDAVKMNERLNQQVKHKDERISSLQERCEQFFSVFPVCITEIPVLSCF